MRRWLVGAALSLAAAGVLYTGVFAQSPSGAKDEAGLEEGNDNDADVRVERLIRTIGEPDAQIGVSIGDVEADAAQAGAKVSRVGTGGPAEKAGIRTGDVITAFDGERVRGARQLSRLVSETPAGRTVDVTVMRDGKPVKLQVTPERRERRVAMRWDGPRPAPPMFRMDPREMPRNEEWFDFHRDLDDLMVLPGGARGRLGVVAQALSPQLADYFGTKQGVLVSTVREDSPAARAGLRAGDVITAVDGEQVDSPAALARATRRTQGEVTIAYTRDRKSAQAKVRLPERETRESRELTRPV